MTSNSPFAKFAASIAASALLFSSAAGAENRAENAAKTASASAKPATKPAFTVQMRKGEVLQVIASELREDGRNAARKYGQNAFPLAQPHGFKRLGQLNVHRKVVSDFAPQAFSFYSWPSQEASNAFEAEPKWPEVKATRPEAWSELKVYSIELEQDLNLSFSPDKHYTVLVAWLKSDEAMADYTRYLKGIEPAVNRAGGKFIYKMFGPTLETHASDPTAPHQMTFVEWDTDNAFENVQKMDEYKAHQQYFSKSMKRFEFYWLTPSTR